MPRSLPALVALVAVAVLTASALARPGSGARTQAAPVSYRDEFLQQFNTSMAKVVALAEALPAEKYAWSPHSDVMPLGRVYAHIARFNYHYPATAMAIAPPAGVDPDTLERVSEKARLVALLRRSAEHVRQSVHQMPESQLAQPTTLYGRRVPQWAVLFQLVAHLNDHMGQSIAYARVAGVVPPWSR